MKYLELIPKYSLGRFKLNDKINNYLDIPHIFEYIEDGNLSYGSYNFYELGITIWTDKDKINSINCIKECFWNDINLIGLLFSDFEIMANTKPDNIEKIYLLVNGRGQNQSVYDFDNLGLQIWVWRKRIVTITISNYDNIK